LTSNAQTIERIRSLLIKAKPQSGATEAERDSAKQMAFKLMEKHGIKKEQLIAASPQPKTQPKPQPKPQQKPSSEWHKKTIPPLTARYKSVQWLVETFVEMSEEKQWFTFKASRDIVNGEISIWCNNHAVMIEFYKAYEKVLLNEQLHRMKEHEKSVQERKYAAEQRKIKEKAADFQKMVIVAGMFIITIFMIAIL